VTFPYEVTIQMVHDINSQAPTAICQIDPTMISFNLMVNRDNPPFNDPDLRQAMQLTIDRKAFLDITSEGKGQIGATMQSPFRFMGPAAGDPCRPCRAMAPISRQPSGGPQADGKARVWAGQAARGQGRDPQYRAIPRSRRHPHRPAEADL